MPTICALAPLSVTLAALVFAGCATKTCSVKPGETAEMYPTYAAWDANAKEWKVPVHGRIYEPAVPSTAQRALQLFRTVMQMPDSGSPLRNFEERAQGFLVKAPSGRDIKVRFADKFYPAAALDKGGHFEKSVKVPASRVSPEAKANGATLMELTGCGEKGGQAGEVFFLDEEGTSVVSTVEDTVQVAGMKQRGQLLQNLLFRDYKAVPGMADLYAAWRRSGAQFHYVAVTPWQLYGPVSRFVVQSGFPPGTFHMNRWGDTDGGLLDRLENMVGLFASDRQTKTKEIGALLEAFPKRQFILVGNTASGDPETFADLARRYPERVHKIYLRGDGEDDARVTAAMAGLKPGSWKVFKEPSELSTDLTRL